MAKDILGLPGTVIPVSADYPWGDIKNAPLGTVVGREMLADQAQFFRKIMDLTGVTPNGLPDNVTNGYQLLEALAGMIAKGAPLDGNGAWFNAGTVAATPSAGTITPGISSTNRYMIMGGTYHWSARIDNFSLSGTPQYIEVQFPYNGGTPGLTVSPVGIGKVQIAGLYFTAPGGTADTAGELLVGAPQAYAGGSTFGIRLARRGLANFDTGPGQYINLNMTFEIAV